MVKCDSGDGTSGSITSVRIKLETGESESNAAVRAWPMKPLAPVMRIFMFFSVPERAGDIEVAWLFGANTRI